MPSYHVVDDLAFCEGKLSLLVVELLRGEPDGLIGLSLTKRPESRRYRLEFSYVGHFKAGPEPFSNISANAMKQTDFLYCEPDSQYLRDLADSVSTFPMTRPWPANPVVRHYVVYAENFVLDVLAAIEPSIQEVTNANVQRADICYRGLIAMRRLGKWMSKRSVAPIQK